MTVLHGVWVDVICMTVCLEVYRWWCVTELEDEEEHVINWSLEMTDVLGSRLYALWNRTAGDCLLDSVLQASWGVMDRDNTLRRALADSLGEAAFTYVWYFNSVLFALIDGLFRSSRSAWLQQVTSMVSAQTRCVCQIICAKIKLIL